MKKLLLLVAVVLAFSFTALAQGTSASGTQTGTETTTTKTTKKSKKTAGETGAAATETSKTAKGGAAKEQTLTGCLAKNADGNGFMLTNGRYKKGVEVKSSEDLSAHVGHEVKLTGTMEKPTAGEKGGAGAKGETMRTFNATAVKHIADTCTAGGKKAAAGMAGEGHKGKKAAKAGAGDTTTPK